MPAELLWETTMDPENRRLIQITLDDIEEAEEAVQICMGKEVAPRREFILQCAE